MRQITTPAAEVANISAIVPVILGGTGATNSEDAALNLGAIPNSFIDQKNGVAKLESNLKVSSDTLPSGTIDYPTLSCPEEIFVNQTVDIVITNYDAQTPYTIEVTAGSFIRNGDTITYTAPSGTTTIELRVNGRMVSFTAKPLAPKTPMIISPVPSSNNIGDTVTVGASAYQFPIAVGEHQSSDWELATDMSFTNVVRQTQDDTISKTQWPVSGLTQDTIYYVRCRYKNSLYGKSAWSPVVAFKTRTTFLNLAETAKFVQITPTANVGFGGSQMALSYDGTRAVIGVPNGAEAGNVFGSVYVFRKEGTTWVRETVLGATGGAANNGSNADAFGSAVAINGVGDIIAVGASGYELSASGLTNSGAVYIFTRSGNTWTRQTVLFAGDPANAAAFGSSLSCDTAMNRLVVGASGVTASSQTLAGALYVFTRTGNTWAQEAKLVQTVPVTNAYMGLNCHMNSDGSRIIAGCPTESSNAGSTYVFVRNGTSWSQEAKLTEPSPGPSRSFGQSAVLNSQGTYAFIGIPGNQPGLTSTNGRVAVFKRNGAVWSYLNDFFPAVAAKRNLFGSDIAIDASSSKLIVTAPKNTVDALANRGSAFICTYIGEVGTVGVELKGSDSIASDHFGRRTAISGNASVALVGTPDHTPAGSAGGTDAGAVYVFQ